MLREAIDVMQRENDFLEEQSRQVSEDFESYRTDLEQLAKENAEYVRVLDMMQTRKREFQAALDELNEMIAMENIVSQCIIRGYRKVSTKVLISSRDQNLSREVMLLTLTPEQRAEIEQSQQ